MAGTGLETRTSILPTPQIPEKGPGILGPDYSFADNIRLPGEVGVYDGDSLNSVVDSLKAVSYYVDTIGFGEPSNPLSRDRPVKALGVNTWMRTGQKCSNGAEAWMYMEGIPRGDAVGQRVADGLKSAGLPSLCGLAPGIVEDAKDALNPVPLLSAVFGSGNIVCERVSQRVGDQDGNIKNPAPNGAYYIENPESVEYRNGVPYQTRWTASKTPITQDQWEKAVKTHCPDGFLKTAHEGRDCNRRLLRTEAFSMKVERRFNHPIGNYVLTGVLVAAAISLILDRKK
jgi:hypothetical protein